MNKKELITVIKKLKKGKEVDGYNLREYGNPTQSLLNRGYNQAIKEVIKLVKDL